MRFKVWTCVSLETTAAIIPSSATLSFSLLIFRLLQTVGLISIFLRHIYSSIIFSMSLGSVCCHQVPFVNKNNTFKCKYKRRLDVKCGIAEPSREPAPMGYKTRYDDNFFDKAFMTLFARKMNNVNGQSGGANQYEEFVQASRRVMHGRSPKQQQEAVRKVLLSMLPPGAPQTFRKLFPPTRWSAEFNAALTVPFFQWLVGPSEVVEVEVNGVKQKSGVHIKKCRYLENSGCVGMCVNMCKIPTQDFFTNEFGLPLTMTPNFEDMSCDMVYGQPPPTPDDDPAFKQPCYAIFCLTAQPDQDVCPKLLS